MKPDTPNSDKVSPHNQHTITPADQSPFIIISASCGGSHKAKAPRKQNPGAISLPCPGWRRHRVGVVYISESLSISAQRHSTPPHTPRKIFGFRSISHPSLWQCFSISIGCTSSKNVLQFLYHFPKRLTLEGCKNEKSIHYHHFASYAYGMYLS